MQRQKLIKEYLNKNPNLTYKEVRKLTNEQLQSTSVGTTQRPRTSTSVGTTQRPRTSTSVGTTQTPRRIPKITKTIGVGEDTTTFHNLDKKDIMKFLKKSGSAKIHITISDSILPEKK
jgi:hypothetical protein